MPHELRYILATAETNETREVEFCGKTFLVFPVVMMCEGVVEAANGPGPELVLASEFSASPEGWNGKPVCGGHPQISGKYVSANDPNVYERESFGLIFNTRSTAKQLRAEAWIDVERAEKNDIGKTVVARARAKEHIEVSVGAFIRRDKELGTYDGKKYEYIWRDPISDHLALLEIGGEGACNGEMGCGAFAAAEARPMAEKKEETPVEKKSKVGAFFGKIGDYLAELRDAAKKDVTDSELRGKLTGALRAVVPAFEWVESVQPFANTVVAVTAPEGKMVYLQYKYTIDAAGNVEIDGDGVEVSPVTKFEPVAAEGATPPEKVKEAPQPAAAEKCGCASKGVEGMAMTKAQRIQALVDAKRFKAEDAPMLEAFSESRLQEMVDEAQGKKKEEAPVTPAATETKSEEEKPAAAVMGASAKTAEQFFSHIEDPIEREILMSSYTREKESRATKIKSLVDAKCPLSAEELGAFTNKRLDELIAFTVKPANYTGQRGSQIARDAEDDEEAPKATGYVSAMRAKSKAQ